jgi:hypothetical protein
MWEECAPEYHPHNDHVGRNRRSLGSTARERAQVELLESHDRPRIEDRPLPKHTRVRMGYCGPLFRDFQQAMRGVTTTGDGGHGEAATGNAGGSSIVRDFGGTCQETAGDVAEDPRGDSTPRGREYCEIFERGLRGSASAVGDHSCGDADVENSSGTTIASSFHVSHGIKTSVVGFYSLLTKHINSHMVSL